MTDAPRRLQRLAAYALCADGDAILLTRIAPGATASDDGKWTLPGGGIAFGEDPRDAAVRELREETGLIGEISDLAAVDSVTGHFVHPEDGIPTDFHGVRILYRVRIIGGELTNEFDGTTDACRWVSAAELADLPRVPLVEVGARLLGLFE